MRRRCVDKINIAAIREESEQLYRNGDYYCSEAMELGGEAHMEQCIAITGEIAAKTAEIVARELNIKIEMEEKQ
jgi:hypothetical protein